MLPEECSSWHGPTQHEKKAASGVRARFKIQLNCFEVKKVILRSVGSFVEVGQQLVLGKSWLIVFCRLRSS